MHFKNTVATFIRLTSLKWSLPMITKKNSTVITLQVVVNPTHFLFLIRNRKLGLGWRNKLCC